MAYFRFADWPEMADDDGEMMPSTARPALSWFGFPSLPGDLGHPSDPYSSLEPEIVRANSEALYYSLTAEKLTATVDPVSAGHNHNTEATLLDWIPLWGWAPGNGLANNATGNGAVVVNSSSFKDLAWGIAVLPSGNLYRPLLVPRVRCTIPGQGATKGTLMTRWKIYSGVSNNDDPLGDQVVEVNDVNVYSDASYPRSNEWTEGDPFVWLGRPGGSTPIQVMGAGRYLLYIYVQVAITAGDALLTELQLGQRVWGK